MTAYVIPVAGQPNRLLNVNSLRGHTRFFANGARAWRTAGYVSARALDLPRPFVVPVRIWVEFTFPNNVRRDTANLYPTAKALVDGLVDSGVLLGDHDGAVEGPWLRRVYPNGSRAVVIVLQEIDRADLGRCAATSLIVERERT